MDITGPTVRSYSKTGSDYIELQFNGDGMGFICTYSNLPTTSISSVM